jgi:hypothetical protein
MNWRTTSAFLAFALPLALTACATSSNEVATPAVAPKARPPTPTPVVTTAPDGSIEVRIHMQAPGGDDQEGTATLRAQGEKTEVTVSLRPAKPSAQPIHIHVGGCEQSLGPVASVLEDVIRGESTTLLNKPISEVLKGSLAINVHESAAAFTTSTACGVVPGLSSVLASPQPSDYSLDYR